MPIGGPQALPQPARLGVNPDNLGFRKQVSALGRVMTEARSNGNHQIALSEGFATVKRFLSITSICASSGVSARVRSAKDWSW